MALIVQKFGGSSVAAPEQIRGVASRIAEAKSLDQDLVVVISAMGNETNELLELASQVSQVQPERELDMLITAGERKASALLCMALADLGVQANSLTGSQAGLQTDTSHQNARIQAIQPDRIKELLSLGSIPVIAGSQGVSVERQVTFLGRGGSDTTAVALAYALEADYCELYTNVDGIFTADPNLVPKAQQMDVVSYDELLDMCATGCPKPAMRAVEVARTYNVALHIRSSFNNKEGTWIKMESMEQAIISAVTYDLSEAKITILNVPDKPGIAARLFRSLADIDVNVDMIVQNVSSKGFTDISFTIPKSQIQKGLNTTQQFSSEIGAKGVESDTQIGRVSLVGAGMKSNPGVAATVFETLSDNKINIQMISTSAIRISCVIADSKIQTAVKALHSAFGLDAKK